MSTLPPGDPIRPDPGAGHRPAKVTLRPAAAGEAETGAMMDPANQSLAEALRVTFYLLMVGLIAIFVLFLLSGFQSIREGESGVRLLFGEVTESDLQPGPRFSFPYPMGELIRVGTGSERLAVDEAFWPKLLDEQKRMQISQLAGIKQQLRPVEDGSLITGDRALAHAQWTVRFRRADPTRFIRNILAEDEEEIVASAVQRAVVQTVAQTPIDDFLKQSGEDQGAVAQRARIAAQAFLDRIESGIVIEQLAVSNKIPPLSVLSEFSNVQGAEQKAAKARSDAATSAREILNAVAGGAHEPLVAQIDEYERAIERKDEAAQARALDTILALMGGSPVEIDGRTIENRVSGEVTRILNEARQYEDTIVSRRRAELGTFQAKLTQFRINPAVVVHRDLSDALMVLLARENVEKFLLPQGTDTLEMLINRDPEIAKAIERKIRMDQQNKLEQERLRQQLQERFRTRTDVNTVRGD